jgi:hypothetical protein
MLSCVAALLAACAGPGWVDLEAPAATQAGPEFRLAGRIQYLDLEGGLFVIRAEDGTQYNPLNLPADFRIDGLAVEADARRRDDVATIGMVGPVLELLRIRRRSA